MAFDRELVYSRGDERPLSRSSERVAFIQRTYAHLAGAILAFIAIEAVLVNVVPPGPFLRLFIGSGFSWLIVLAAFMGVSWLAQTWARSETSVGMQYAGLALYVVAEAVIILPLLLVVHYSPQFARFGGDAVIAQAGILTLMLFGGLTLSVFWTGKDYSPLRPILCVGSLIALGVIICACIFGFSLGLFFCFAMVALLSGFILYETSQIMLHWRTDQHVAAALMLFSSIATLFWYILRILMILNSRD
jgi:FtsH-binding integral membrane protein